MRRATGLISLFAVLGLAAVGGWLILQLTGPRQSSGEPIRVTAQVERRTFEETVVARGVFTFAVVGRASAVASGRVTAVYVSAGDSINEGDQVLAIDGRPAIAANLATPFWRALSLGSAGQDVAQLQAMLSSFGYEVPVDGEFNSATEDALIAWQTATGFAVGDGVLQPGDTVMGAWPLRVGHVNTAVGDLVQPGTELVQFTAAEAGVRADLLPSDRLRVDLDDQVRIELAATGQTATGRIVHLSESPTVQPDGSLTYAADVALDEGFAATEGAQVRVVVVVTRREDALAVPLAAIVSDESGDPAVRVVDDGRTRLATVELGISEGAWIEIVSGLTGDEVVVVAER